jgi:hypothetical protein
MAEPLAYFITWATYGTWLPGDERGWVEYRRGRQLPDPIRKLEAQARMTEDACRLDAEQREVVERQVVETCRFRGWHLHAVNCRSNHLHIVVTAGQRPEVVRSQLKAWCTRRLKELQTRRQRARAAAAPRLRVGLVSDPPSAAADQTPPTRSVSEGASIVSAGADQTPPTRSVSEAASIVGERAPIVSEGPIRENWWAERGSQRFINDDDSLEAVILYVRDGQDQPQRRA